MKYQICQYSYTWNGRKRVRWYHIGGRWLAKREGALEFNAFVAQTRVTRLLSGSLPGYSYAYVEVGKRRPAF